MKTNTLSPKLLRQMDAYWRAANYLSVGQIYLYDNPLLKVHDPSSEAVHLKGQRYEKSARPSEVVMIIDGCQPIGFVPVAGVESFLFLGDEVFAVVSAPTEAENTVASFQLMPHCDEHERNRLVRVSELLASFRWLHPDCPGVPRPLKNPLKLGLPAAPTL